MSMIRTTWRIYESFHEPDQGSREKNMSIIDLPYGDDILPVGIPDAFLGEIVSPLHVLPAPDPITAVQHAMAKPIGTPPLRELIRSGHKVAVIIDDVTRKTPTVVMLPPLLSELQDAGIGREDIFIVIALGTHRPMTASEIELKVGSAIAEDYRIVNVPAWDDSEMVYLGTSHKGVPIWVNRRVAKVDIRIGVGTIMPHLDVGYGGGGKIILPGVCGTKTVEAFHTQMARIDTNQLGVVDATLRLDLEDFVGECVGLDFILNAILDRNGKLYACVSGHFVKAHRAGVRFAREVYGVPVKRRYPLVLANAYPHQIDLWQSTKALASGEIMTEDGGTLIIVADCPEGNKTHPFFAEYIGKDLDRLLIQFDKGEIEDRVAAAEAVTLCRMKQRIKIGLVSSGLTRKDAEKMGFAYYDSVEEGIKKELEGKKDKKIGVLTNGGVIIPLIES